MSLIAQAQMTEDNGLIIRVAAAAALRGVLDPRPWAARNMWALTAREGWTQAYTEASADDEPVDPAAWSGVHGYSPDVITDQMIIDGVSAILSDEPEER